MAGRRRRDGASAPPLRPAPGAIPPQDLDAEGAVLAACLLDTTGAAHASSMSALGAFGASAFYADANARIFEAIATVLDDGRALDIVAVAHQLDKDNRLRQVGGKPYLASLIDCSPNLANVDSHAQIVREKCQQRRLIAQCQLTAAGGYSLTGNTSDWIEEHLSKVMNLFESAGTAAMTSMSDAAQEAHAAQILTQQQGGSGISSGLLDIDKFTTGFHAGDLTVLAARPGMGKSALALKFAQGVATQGYAVPIFSLEMQRLQIAQRYIAAHGHIDLKRIREGALQASELQQFTDTIAGTQNMTGIADWPVWIDDSASTSLFDIRAQAMKLKREVEAGRHPLATQKKVGLIVVDYLQLMEATADSREQEISGISRGLKLLAKSLEVPVLALSQLNRDVEKRGGAKRPQLSDLRESGAIEQDADNIWFVYRPGAYNDKNDPALEGFAEVIIAKARHGPTGMRKLAWNGPQTRFSNYEGGGYEAGHAGGYDHSEDDDEYEAGF